MWLTAAPALSRYLTVSRWLFSHASIRGVLCSSSDMSRLAPAYRSQAHTHTHHSYPVSASTSCKLATVCIEFVLVEDIHSVGLRRAESSGPPSLLRGGVSAHLDQHVADLVVPLDSCCMQGGALVLTLHQEVGVFSFHWNTKADHVFSMMYRRYYDCA